MSVSLVYIGAIVGMLALVLGLTLLAMRLVRWRRDIALRRHSAPVLVMPLAAEDVAAPRPLRERIEPAGPVGFPEAATLPRGVPVVPSPVRFEEPGALPDEDDPAVSTGPFRPGEVRPGSPSAHLVLGSQVRFFRAEEGTLEFLPGRLEVVGGDDIGQEIHLVRQMGEDHTTLTFGRAEGTPLHHIQLLDPTVSRQHARMTWDGSVWCLTNLSVTNPVVLNGAALGHHEEAVALQDGDRIEMGAVVFVFHGR